MTLHYAPTTPEEEELALALALSASLSSAQAARKPASPAAPPRPALAASSSAHTLLQRGPSHGFGPSSSPPRSRWPVEASTSISQRSMPSCPALLNGQPGRISPGRSVSPSRLARPHAQQQYPPPQLQQHGKHPQPSCQQPPVHSHMYPPTLTQQQQQQQPPRQSQAHLPPIVPPVIPRSRSTLGPNSLIGASAGRDGGGGVAGAGGGDDGGGGGGSSNGGSGRKSSADIPVAASASPRGISAPARTSPQLPRQLYSDPDACAGCGQGFGLFTLRWVTGMGRKWHSGCFKCGFCQEPISSSGGSYYYQTHPDDPLPYHPDCYRHVHHPMCHVCGQYVAASPDGAITYLQDGFWREKYCATHAGAELTRCCACSRLQKQGEEWAPLPDGRPLCLQCLSSVVLDTPDAQPLYDEVLSFYAREMHLAHVSKPPLLLVDGPTLNTHAEKEGRDDSAGAPVFHVQGLCVAHVYSHVTSILRGAGGLLRSVATELLTPAAGSQGAGGSSSSSTVVHCHVKVLLVLYGLPRLLCGSIMAHELMHAWLRMEGVIGLSQKVEEGLCQLMACLWLDRQHELLRGKPEEQRLASYFSYKIRTDTSEVYGDGFREAMEAFQSIGLNAMIQNVKRLGRFTAL